MRWTRPSGHPCGKDGGTPESSTVHSSGVNCVNCVKRCPHGWGDKTELAWITSGQCASLLTTVTKKQVTLSATHWVWPQLKWVSVLTAEVVLTSFATSARCSLEPQDALLSEQTRRFEAKSFEEEKWKVLFIYFF